MIIKSLPLANPGIKAFQYHAFQFAITDCYDITAPYKFSNYIQLFCDTEKFEKSKLFHLDFYPSFQDYSFFNPYLKIERCAKSFINKFKIDIIDVISNAIENNKYVYLFLDEYYIPRKYVYKKSHMQHDCLLSGINSKSNLLLLSGYDFMGNYSTWWVSFDDFCSAFYSTNAFLDDYDYFDRIYCFEFNKKYTYKFDIESVCKSLGEYLYSQNSEINLSLFKNPSSSKKYGLSIYEIFIRYIKTVHDLKTPLDIRPVCLLREHKRLMTERISYLEENGYLYGKYSQPFGGIYTYVQILTNLSIKYRISPSDNLIYNMIDRINGIYSMEKDALYQVYRELVYSNP